MTFCQVFSARVVKQTLLDHTSYCRWLKLHVPLMIPALEFWMLAVTTYSLELFASANGALNILAILVYTKRKMSFVRTYVVLQHFW